MLELGVACGGPISTSIIAPSFCCSNEYGKRQSLLDTNAENIYRTSVIEIVNVDDFYYTFNYYKNIKGLRTISITNESTEIIDTLVYDDLNSMIYLNNKAVASVNNVFSYHGSNPHPNYGEIMGSYSRKIGLIKDTDAAVVSAIISLVLTTCGGAGVVSALGTKFLSSLAACKTGGIITWTWYQYISTFTIADTNVWTFDTYTGERYGPYATIYVF